LFRERAVVHRFIIRSNDLRDLVSGLSRLVIRGIVQAADVKGTVTQFLNLPHVISWFFFLLQQHDHVLPNN
jgi:hypothetical protein